MIEEQPHAIPLSGMVHNTTKIGVQDGQSEDLVNLRFKDGAWRATGDGKRVFSIKDELGNHEYEQLYIHTNIYRHLLGVERDLSESGERLDTGTLYWIADLTPKEDAASIEEEDFVFEPIERVALTRVTGDLTITQTGHLITIIDEADDFEFFVYKTNSKQYRQGKVDVKGSVKDRSLFPFGNVHFNYYSSIDEDHVFKQTIENSQKNNTTIKEIHEGILNLYAEACKKNKFTRPFLAVAAIELYDGSYAYAGNPVLICPRQSISADKISITRNDNLNYDGTISKGAIDISKVDEDSIIGYIYSVPRCDASFENKRINHLTDEGMSETFHIGACAIIKEDDGNRIVPIPDESCPVLLSGYGTSAWEATRDKESYINNTYMTKNRDEELQYSSLNVYESVVIGSDLCVSIEDPDVLKNNEDLFSAVCVFITPEVDDINLSENGWEDSIQYSKDRGDSSIIGTKGTADSFCSLDLDDTYHSPYGDTILVGVQSGGGCYFPPRRKPEDIEYDLMHSSLYLLKRYNKYEFEELCKNPVIDLTKKIDEAVLQSIDYGGGDKVTLTSESITRMEYTPKKSFLYNGRLHIANYKAGQFHGYSIDSFNLNNHSVKYENGALFKGVLPNLANNNDEYTRWGRTQKNFTTDTFFVENNLPVAICRVEVRTNDGEQTVTRYVGVGDNIPTSWIEDLDPLITFPDYRASHIDIYLALGYDIGANVIRYNRKSIDLNPHVHLNIAYSITEDLNPRAWGNVTGGTMTKESWLNLIKEENAEEYFPNGLKVSKTNQPMYFPVENTYQVGSSEIVAMCSNAIAVGTGQTGSAPLYVFCKDGVYALFVDSSGQMAYTNARVIARDVCNNAKSVTPIDAGVVFTTDRGLMMIAGEQVEEIGQPLEGDWCKFTKEGDKDYSKHAAASYIKVAGFPDDSVTRADFLQYLKGSIVNYNHNERELMVSNPDYKYTYILDRDGNWGRREYSADEYVNNYPTSYRVENGVFYQVDKESDADNSIFAMSNVIKLESIGFKELHRVIARGFFETIEGKYAQIIIQGSYDGRKWATLAENHKAGTFRDLGCTVMRVDCRFFRFILSGQLTKESRFDFFELTSRGSKLSSKPR